jgi:periplasmic protein TonB
MKKLFYLFTLLFQLSTFKSFAQDQTAVPNQAEVMPEFPGGGDALMNYLNTNLRLPENVAKDSTFNWCKALVTFIIEADGSVKNPVLVRECQRCEDCDREALRVISTMPKWKPGMNSGKAIAVQMGLPVFFNKSLKNAK